MQAPEAFHKPFTRQPLPDLSQYGSGTGGYGRRDYVEDFLTQGKFPKIHDAIMTAAKHHLPEGKRLGNVLDIGCSIGLSSLNLVANAGADFVVGFEPQKNDVALFNAVLNDGTDKAAIVHGVLDLLSQDSRVQFIDLCKRHNITTLFARRVINELVVRYGNKPAGVVPSSNGVVIEDAADVLSDTLIDAGIDLVVLQGRAFSSRSTHPVPDIVAEMSYLLPRFAVQYRSGQVGVMFKR